MAVTAAMVKELRAETGAGMMDCKNALVETDGDIEAAVDVLREKGLAKAAKKADRIAAEGLVRLAFSEDRKTAAIIEVNSETDFVSKNPEFVDFVEKLADIALAAEDNSMDKFMEMYYPDGGKVSDALNQKISKIGENMNIRRFAKFNAPGVVYTGYIHGGGRIGVIVGLETEASAEDIEVIGKDVAMQVASMNPKFVREEEVDKDWLANEEKIAREQLLNEGKKPELLDRIIPGKLKAILKEVCLVDQKFVKNSDQTVSEYVDEASKSLGKDAKINEAVRYEVGEGIEKKQECFAEEVAAQIND